MRLWLLYKLANKDKTTYHPGPNIPLIQKSKASEADQKHSDIVKKIITPYTNIDPLQTPEVKKTANVDISPTYGYTGSVYGNTETINKDRKLKYISKLFNDLVDRNFQDLSPEELT